MQRKSSLEVTSSVINIATKEKYLPFNISSSVCGMSTETNMFLI